MACRSRSRQATSDACSPSEASWSTWQSPGPGRLAAGNWIRAERASNNLARHGKGTVRQFGSHAVTEHRLSVCAPSAVALRCCSGQNVRWAHRPQAYVPISPQFRRDAPQIVEQDFHVAQGCSVIHDAAAECETAAEARIGKIGATVALKGQKQAFV